MEKQGSRNTIEDLYLDVAEQFKKLGVAEDVAISIAKSSLEFNMSGGNISRVGGLTATNF